MLFQSAKIFKRNKNHLVILISALFILINAVCIALEVFYFMLFPLALLILYLAFFKLDALLLLIVFLVPLSIPLQEMTQDISFNMSLPAEPLLFSVLLLFIFKTLYEKKFDKKILRHPISIAIYLNFFWLLITTISSSMPFVSFKYILARLWFLVGFYFIATQVFAKYKNIKRYIWIYIIPLMLVMAYTITRHFSYGVFDKQVAHWVMSPFYNDHTAYAAVLAMFFPVLLGFSIRSTYTANIKLFIWLIVFYFAIAIILSYTRAAWLSLAGAFGVWLVIMLKIKFRTLLVLSVSLLVLFFSFKTQIFLELERNRQDSSAEFHEHIKSMSNISSDASNLERINRWKSAFRMFSERPFFGWGPGTYQFKYAPFQFSYERTIISTNAGDGGNAHSEYIGPLAESGVLGMLTVFGIVASVIYTAIKVYLRSRKKEIKMLSLTLMLGLVTYFIHGFLNNFLDTDKASAPFWGFIAAIVALDVYHEVATKKEKQLQ